MLDPTSFFHGHPPPQDPRPDPAAPSHLRNTGPHVRARFRQQLHSRFRAKSGYEEERGTTFGVHSVYITIVARFDEVPQRGLIGLLRGSPPRGFILDDDVFGYEVCGNPRRLVVVFPLDEVLHSVDGVKVSTADDAFNFTTGLVFTVFGSCLLLVLECGGDNMQGRVLPLECVIASLEYLVYLIDGYQQYWLRLF
ncbi:uncharacterized protein HKW66_Vig0246450 [Vigna angularis]|uniref:Uncharacterized protein n=1 Tax=Phaseolus angularis TaxID=3914 RepID=A0A8T0KCH4_PHAAN|nr:uncharacterized protein HKW66_Vig0246450 [Vigna angularis]